MMKISLFIATAMLVVSAGSTHAQTTNSGDEETVLLQLRAVAKQQGISMTPEQEQRFLQQRRAIQDRMKAGALGLTMMGGGGQRDGQVQSSVATPVVPANSQTEENLAQKIASLPGRPTPFVIEDRKDGFIVNGKGFIDPEGRIRNFAISPVSGMVAYMAETGLDRYIIKIGRAGTDAEAIPVAFASRNGGGWQVETVTGKRINGASLTMLSGGGFLVSRETAAFIYSPGKGLRSVPVPNGYVVAGFQHGDVLDTDYLLIERDMGDANAPGTTARLFNSFKSLGSALGINAKEDYALLNIATSEIIPINISESGKTVARYSQCRRKNSVVNACDNVDFRESLYDSTGRNMTHYYWRINWFNSKNGPVLIALENSLKNITIKDLKTGKKVVAFNRALGISGFEAIQDSDGNIRIEANMGFSSEKMDDALAFLASAPDVKQAANSEPAAAGESAQTSSNDSNLQ